MQQANYDTVNINRLTNLSRIGEGADAHASPSPSPLSMIGQQYSAPPRRAKPSLALTNNQYDIKNYMKQSNSQQRVSIIRATRWAEVLQPEEGLSQPNIDDFDGEASNSQFSQSSVRPGMLQQSPSIMTRLTRLTMKDKDLKLRLKSVKRHEQFGPPPKADVLGELIIQEEKGTAR